MADTNPNLQAQYLTQVEADLQRNAQDKERITAELARLQGQLAALEQDNALLVGMRQALASTTAAPEQDTTSATAPAQAAQTSVPRARRPKTTPRTPKTPTPKKTKAAKAAASSGAATGTPTLVELVTIHLTGHTEPHSATEIASALTTAHPSRKIQTTVVRNTLEALVAKGQALRSKQGRSVYYSAPQPSPAAHEPTEPAPATA